MFYYFLQFLEKKLVLLISTYKVFFIGIFYLYSCQMSGIASVCFSWVVILSWTQVLNLVFAKVSPHNFIKVSLLTAYNSIYKFDIICSSETYLNSETFSNNENLNIPGYNLIRVDHLSNDKRGGVFIYFKESLPLRLYNVSYLNECICFEIMISNKLCNFISLYRSPSQSSDEFENFVYNLDLTLEALTQKNPFLTVIIGDFNAKFNKWCSTDKTTPKGAKLDNLTSELIQRSLESFDWKNAFSN